MWNSTRTLGLHVYWKYTCDIRVYQKVDQGLKPIFSGVPNGTPIFIILLIFSRKDVFFSY